MMIHVLMMYIAVPYIRSVTGGEGQHDVKEVQAVLGPHHDQVAQSSHPSFSLLLQGMIKA
jgi:hypothetical protein